MNNHFLKARTFQIDKETGRTTGIGLATAKLFQEEGAQVIVTGRSTGSLADAQKEFGSKALAVQSDTSKLATLLP